MRHFPLIIVLSILALGCETRKADSTSTVVTADTLSFRKGSFGYDLAFLKKNEQVILLGTSSHSARVLIVPDYQGRVMTSTAGGDEGNSYGWINYDLVQSDSLLTHFNPFGGEDRIWIGPEGGQYSVFFKKGSPFDFENWQTPAVIDTQPFDLVSSDSVQATFKKSALLTNYSGFTFTFDIGRQILLWNDEDILREFGITVKNLQAVAFESKNSIRNTGPEIWKKKTGLISLWILGMFTPSDKTTIVLPYSPAADYKKKTGLISLWILGMFTPSDKTTIVLPYSPAADYKKKITDNYFGEIPPDRLVKSTERLFLKADGRHRGKVGIAPSIAKDIAGSYDADKHILTLIKFDLEKTADYVNSKWEIQKEPYRGDAVNSYNDGPLASGGQLGPFYELESSSPAKELKPGETLTHRHITLHLEGDESLLNEIAMKTLGVSLKDISNAFQTK